MTELLCAEGHVVPENRQTCDRCNGLPITDTNGNPIKLSDENEVIPEAETSAPEKTVDEPAPQPEIIPEITPEDADSESEKGPGDTPAESTESENTPAPTETETMTSQNPEVAG